LFAVSDKHFIGTPSGDTLKPVAGKSGTSGSTGDNAKPSAALLNTPAGIATDPKADRYFIADSLNHKVRLVEGDKISTAAGTTSGYSGDNGTATAAKLNNCTGVALDPWGNLYIADTGRLADLPHPCMWSGQQSVGPRKLASRVQHCCPFVASTGLNLDPLPPPQATTASAVWTAGLRSSPQWLATAQRASVATETSPRPRASAGPQASRWTSLATCTLLIPVRLLPGSQSGQQIKQRQAAGGCMTP
jgi:hypothetical protein